MWPDEKLGQVEREHLAHRGPLPRRDDRDLERLHFEALLPFIGLIQPAPDGLTRPHQPCLINQHGRRAWGGAQRVEPVVHHDPAIGVLLPP